MVWGCLGWLQWPSLCTERVVLWAVLMLLCPAGQTIENEWNFICDYERINEWTTEWMVGWLDKWMDVRMNATRHVSVSKRKPQETGPRGRPNMLPIFNSWGSVAGVEGSTESGTSDFITTPRLLSCSALAFYCLIYSSSCCPPPTTKPKFDLDAG